MWINLIRNKKLKIRWFWYNKISYKLAFYLELFKEYT
jgi:hypothetical protein